MSYSTDMQTDHGVVEDQVSKLQIMEVSLLITLILLGGAALVILFWAWPGDKE